ncbi:MAG: HAMP domain-containing histidine kinase [Deltaproteobacteria bacterium]|nr:HAMP domain-containing histidine kinase [Deltaproteobacteria bacterium]
MRLSVATKIFLGFAVVIIAFGATETFTLYRMSALRRTVTVLWKELNPMANQLRALSRQLKSTEEFLALNRADDILWLEKVLPTLDPFESPQGFSRLAERLDALIASDEVSGDTTDLLALGQTFRRLVTGHELADILQGEELPEVFAKGEVLTNAELYKRLVVRTVKVAGLGNLKPTSLETRAMTRVLRRLNREVNDAVRALAAPIRQIEQKIADDERTTTLAVGFVAAGALGVSIVMLFVAQLTLRPIRKLREGARRIAAGDYAERVAVPSADELGQLGEEFNRMAASLEERDKALADKQAELVQAERLAAVGRLAAQITHEVRNPLSSIGLNAELLEDELEELPDPKGARAMLASIASEVQRLKRITEQYLQLTRFASASNTAEDDPASPNPEPHAPDDPSRPAPWPSSLASLAAGPRPEPHRVPCDVGALVLRFADFLRREADEAHVRLVTDGIKAASDGGPPPLQADPEQLWQALLNVARNALEALQAAPGATGEAAPEARTLTLSLSALPGGGVFLTVADNGPGIPSELRARLFQPFATGKPHGTGLGLVVTRDIVLAHGGRIAVRSPTTADGRGTAFDIALPQHAFASEARGSPVSGT